MKKTSTFQIVLIIIALAGALMAVLVFSGAIKIGGKSSATNPIGNVTLWGTVNKASLSKLFDDFNRVNKTFSVTYVQKNADTFDTDLAEAIASGAGPDLVFLPQDSIIRHQNKIFHIPYTSLPKSTFTANFTQESELYLASDGIVALPMTIDPLVLYYNRTLFENAGIATGPKTWNDVAADVALLTKKQDQTILQSGIALGSVENIDHADDIIAMLLLQSGNPIVTERTTKPPYFPMLNAGNVDGSSSQAIDFFIQFSDPLRPMYTWNRSLPSSKDAFTREKTAMYIGYLSEIPEISQTNGNLNFDIARMPQLADEKAMVTFGNMQGIAIMKSTKNFNTAFAVANLISGKDFLTKYIHALIGYYPVAPARRDMLAVPPKDIYFGPILYNSALIARGWYTPTPSASKDVLGGLVQNVIRGVFSTDQALADANDKLSVLLR